MSTYMLRKPAGDRSEIKDARKSKDYMPTLDGWRAISILAVMCHHSALLSVGFFSTRWLYDYGYVGVDVFFAISGLLICSRLLAEERRFGAISLKQFYVRRAFRILPPAMLYLIVLSVLSGLAWIPHVGRDIFGALFFFRNYTSLMGQGLLFNGWFTAHFWSLSVEEHFYLLLPAILCLTRKRQRLYVLGGVILVIAVSLAVQLQHRNWTFIQYHSDVRLDSLVIPALFAVLIQREKILEWSRRLGYFWPVTFTAIVLIIGLTTQNLAHQILLSILMPIMILSTVQHPRSLLGRFLELAPLRFVGRISYTAFTYGSSCSLSVTFTRTHPLSGHFSAFRSTSLPPSPARLPATICWKSQPCTSATAWLPAFPANRSSEHSFNLTGKPIRRQVEAGSAFSYA